MGHCVLCFRANSCSSLSIDNSSRMLLLRIDKWDLDVAHKDKQNKLYSSDFRVSMCFLLSLSYREESNVIK
jgi:hypothetical protein